MSDEELDVASQTPRKKYLAETVEINEKCIGRKIKYLKITKKIKGQKDFSLIPPNSLLIEAKEELRCKANFGVGWCAQIGGKYYDIEAITKCLKILEDLKLREEVLEERSWYEKVRTDLQQPNMTPPLEEGIAEQFFSTIQNNAETYYYEDAKLTVSQMKALVGERWLNGAIISRIVALLNAQSKDTFTFDFNVSKNANDIPHILHRNLRKKWPDCLPKKLAFSIHVGSTGDGKVYIGDVNYEDINVEATHFTSCVYDSKTNCLFYGDSLALPVPEKFLKIFTELLGLIYDENTASQCSFESMHCNDHSLNQIHECSSKCWHYFPLQKDHASCGISAIFCMCLAALNDESFFSLRGWPELDILDFGCPDFGYLRDLSQFGDYLRLVIVKWLFSGSVDLSLACAKETPSSKDCNDVELISLNSESDIARIQDDFKYTDISHFRESIDPDFFRVFCTGNDNCNVKRKHYHCKLCPFQKKEFFESNFTIHFESAHMKEKRIVKYRSLNMLPCKAIHEDKTFIREDVAHYHCPICGGIIQQKTFFEKHLKIHDVTPSNDYNVLNSSPKELRLIT